MAAPQSPDECICKILNSYLPRRRTQHSSLEGEAPAHQKLKFFNVVQKGDRGHNHTILKKNVANL